MDSTDSRDVATEVLFAAVSACTPLPQIYGNTAVQPRVRWHSSLNGHVRVGQFPFIYSTTGMGWYKHGGCVSVQNTGHHCTGTLSVLDRKCGLWNTGEHVHNEWSIAAGHQNKWNVHHSDSFFILPLIPEAQQQGSFYCWQSVRDLLVGGLINLWSQTFSYIVFI